MKRFKIGFLAVVAILAMSFTVASHKNLLKAKDVVTCGTSASFASAVQTIYDASCNTYTFSCTLDLTTVPKYAFNATQNNSQFECTTPDGDLCCFELGSTTSICSPPNTKSVKPIIAIHCGEKSN